MKRTQYIYSAGSISIHRSERFAHRANRIAIKSPRAPQIYKQKAASGRPPGHGKRKTDPKPNKSVLPFHHTTLACTAQAEKGSSQNPHLILYKGELT
ncbi:hypothetical protein B5E65_05490 [Gemmiger sp. An120]|uniref:hypothetical protein n=1 Tax=Gemmiger sp. An120 TaxID=1965549 RepID=UPI000B380EBA|nr:hypothetical protein [Gemmiger sp. An120]OUQ43227.1 hypothetical protein B5E65_05490 [Gemmiger sp. An120]